MTNEFKKSCDDLKRLNEQAGIPTPTPAEMAHALYDLDRELGKLMTHGHVFDAKEGCFVDLFGDDYGKSYVLVDGEPLALPQKASR